VTFLSGAVLDLAATLGVALVAVAVGLRLVSGNVGLQAGLTVLLLAPEVLPHRCAASARSTTRAPTASPSPTGSWG
jgi:ABC-type transport system involved in cytochrome bd biosynthesis fused ATPase/permease subunit